MLSILLTPTESNSNLFVPLPHEAVRVAALENKRRKPLQCGIFMRKSQLHIIMLGLSEALERVAGFVCSSTATLLSSQHHDCSHVVGFNTLQTEAVMPNNSHAQSAASTESQLIELSQVIGSIADSNASFTLGLAQLINKIGKPLSEITLSELAALVNLYSDAFNTGIVPNFGQVTVSPTKAKSLHKQHDIIGHSLDIFCLDPNEINRAYLKIDTLELARMLDYLPPSPKKTSCFNVLSHTRKLIAERVPFNQAMQYQDCIVKFAGMVAYS